MVSREALLGAYGKAVLATLLWGSSFIAVRYALETTTAYGLVWMRNAIGAAVLLLILRLRGERLLVARKDLSRVLLLGLIFGMHLLLQALAIERTTTVRAGWIIAFIPAVVAIGAWLFQRQRLRAIGWLGIIIASFGVLVLTSSKPAQLAEAGVGDLLMFISTFTWAAYTLLSAGPARSNGGMCVTANALAVSVVPNLLVAVFNGSTHAPWSANAMIAVVLLGIGASAVAMWAFTSAVVELGAERSSAFQYIQPLVTMLAAHLFLAEHISVDQLIAGPVILVGVWFVQRGKRD